MTKTVPVIRRLPLALLPALLLPLTLRAATFTSSFDTLTGYFSAYDLEEADRIDGSPTTPTDHWAIFGPVNTNTGTGDDLTTKTSSSPFSGVSRIGEFFNDGELGSRIKFAHDGGSGDFPLATGSSDAHGA
jgi:hypothetical protein